MMKEKMIMKLEKERLVAKVDNLEKSLLQLEEGTENPLRKSDMKSKLLETQEQSLKKTNKKAKYQTGIPTEVPGTDPNNQYQNEENEPMSVQMNLLKTFKGHLMGVTGLAYNQEKKILATCSDDSTWKLWSVPNGDLIMSGEGHQDWASDVSFHPDYHMLATSSGDGTVKVWDILKTKCAITYNEHP